MIAVINSLMTTSHKFQYIVQDVLCTTYNSIASFLLNKQNEPDIQMQ